MAAQTGPPCIANRGGGRARRWSRRGHSRLGKACLQTALLGSCCGILQYGLIVSCLRPANREIGAWFRTLTSDNAAVRRCVSKPNNATRCGEEVSMSSYFQKSGLNTIDPAETVSQLIRHLPLFSSAGTAVAAYSIGSACPGRCSRPGRQR